MAVIECGWSESVCMGVDGVDMCACRAEVTESL